MMIYQPFYVVNDQILPCTTGRDGNMRKKRPYPLGPAGAGILLRSCAKKVKRVDSFGHLWGRESKVVCRKR